MLIMYSLRGTAGKGDIYFTYAILTENAGQTDLKRTHRKRKREKTMKKKENFLSFTDRLRATLDYSSQVRNIVNIVIVIVL